MKASAVTLGPMIGHTTTEFSRIWIRGDVGCFAVARYRQSSRTTEEQSAGEWRYEKFPALVESSDYCATLDLPFGASDTLEIAACIVSVDEANGDVASIDWEALPADCRARVQRPPPAGFAEPYSFIAGSCRHIGYTNDRQGDRAFETILAQQGQHRDSFVLMCGDQIYADHPTDENGFIGAVKNVLRGIAPATFAAYCEVYRAYFRLPKFRALLAQCPGYMIFDDHEIRDNWAGWKYKAQLQEKGKKVWDPAQLNVGLQAYFAYQAMHSPGAKPARAGQWWYEFQWGNSAFFVLDLRSERTNPSSANASIVEKAQYSALCDFLNMEDQNIRHHFIISPVPIAPDTGTKSVEHSDTWRAYPEHRNELLTFLRDSARNQPIFICGDSHVSQFVEVRSKQKPDFRLKCIMSSAFNWFMFGTQVKRFIPGLAGAITFEPNGREHPLPATASEVSNKRDRKGDFYVEPISETEQHNNFVRIRISGQAATADLTLAKNGHVIKTWSL